MPPYVVDGINTNTPVPLLIPNVPGYSYGSRASGPATRMFVSKSAVASNVVTLTVQIVEGNIPSVGDTVYVTATANNAGALNQPSGVALTAVNITAATGAGTISYALSTGNLSVTTDSGVVVRPVPEAAETLIGIGAGQQFAVSGYGVTWSYNCPSQPGALAIQLEGAINDQSSEYTLIGSSQTTTSGYNEFFATLPELVQFVRLHVTSISGGTSPTIIGKIMCSKSQK